MGSPHELEGHSNEQLWQEGLRTFNEGDYFMTHEYLEELWRRHDGDLSKFYQGLLQAAVSLYHYGNGNFHGAKLLANGYVAVGRFPQIEPSLALKNTVTFSLLAEPARYAS